MKKSDILKLVLRGAQLVPGPVGLIAAGVGHVIQRDNDPSNDLTETANGIAEIVTSVVATAEGLSHQDFVDNAALALLTQKATADLAFYVQAVHNLKPSAHGRTAPE